MKEIITSLQNQTIKDLIKLEKARERKKQDLIIIEGRHEISLALEAGIKITKLFLCISFNSDVNFKVEVSPDIIEQVSDEVFLKISHRESPDGYIAIAKRPNIELNNVKLNKNPLIVILESLEKPGNIGAIIRTCDATGVDAIIVNEPKSDIFSPNVIRASLGSIFAKQIVVAGRGETKKWLKANKISTFATTPHTQTDYLDVDYSKPSAIIIGTEHEGISEDWINDVDHKIRIEMKGNIDSLNASVSAAVVLFEAVRQRR